MHNPHLFPTEPDRIKSDVKGIVERELIRIAADPELAHLLEKKK